MSGVLPMTVDHIRYDLLTQDALRGVLRAVLADAAKNGLPGEHHFYISFDTTAEGVRLSPRMLAQYPKEMTIVLQHQFWDLEVKDDGFEVGLSFGGVAERLAIPFAAIKGFFDPAVQFGLQFQEVSESVDEGAEKPAGEPPGPERVAKGQPLEPRQAPAPLAAVPQAANPEESAGPEDAGPADAGAEIVRLDRFRKK